MMAHRAIKQEDTSLEAEHDNISPTAFEAEAESRQIWKNDDNMSAHDAQLNTHNKWYRTVSGNNIGHNAPQ